MRRDELTAADLGLELFSDAKAKQSLTNYVRLLENHPQLAGRFHRDEWVRSDVVELPLPWDKGSGVRPLCGDDLPPLMMLAEKHGMTAHDKYLRDAISYVSSKHPVNPVKEKLMGLERGEEAVLGTVLKTYLGADVPHIEEIERVIFGGIVARLCEPGVKFDYMPVLQGAQGIGKSTLCHLLALTPDMFSDSIGSFNEPRKWWYQTEKKSIVEVAELAAFEGIQSQEVLKSFISSEVDEWCPNYGKELVSRPRTFVLLGTTNADRFLSDPTGNRRFIPIRCSATSAHPGLFDGTARQDILHAMAEARDEYLAGRLPLVLPAEAEASVECARIAAMRQDPVPEKVTAYMRGTSRERVSVKTVLEEALGAEDEHGNSALARKVKGVVLSKCGDQWEWAEGLRFDGRSGNGFVRRGGPKC